MNRVMLTHYFQTYLEVSFFSLTPTSPQDVCLMIGSDLPLHLNNVQEQVRMSLTL